MLKRINTKDSELNRIQDNVDQELSSLQSMPMVGGNVLTGVALTGGSITAVPHKLQRTAQYWILLGQDSNSNVWVTSIDTKYLYVSCSNSCNVIIWVN